MAGGAAEETCKLLDNSNELLDDVGLNDSIDAFKENPNNTDAEKINTKISKNLPRRAKKAKDAPTVLHDYIMAHIKDAQIKAQELASNKCCKCKCPNGILLQVRLVEGYDIIIGQSALKNLPEGQHYSNLSKRYPCKE